MPGSLGTQAGPSVCWAGGGGLSRPGVGQGERRRAGWPGGRAGRLCGWAGWVRRWVAGCGWSGAGRVCGWAGARGESDAAWVHGWLLPWCAGLTTASPGERLGWVNGEGWAITASPG
jgi:hypothetical protein